MPARAVGFEATKTDLPARSTIRTIGPVPGAGCPSMATLSVAVQGWPAFGATSAAVIVMFRSFASAVGAARRAASAASTLSLRIVPPWSSGIHRRRDSGSAGSAGRTAADDGGSRAAQLNEDGGRVVRVGALQEHVGRVGAMDEHEAAAKAGDVDRLALLQGHVVVAEAGSDALADRRGAGPV